MLVSSIQQSHVCVWYVLSSLNVWLFATPWTTACHWIFPSKNTGVGCHFLLQEIFQAQGSNLVYCIGRLILHH